MKYFIITLLILFLLIIFSNLNAISFFTVRGTLAFTTADSLQKLIEAKANVNEIDANKEPVLYHALRNNLSYECINLLIKAGANVKYKNEDGTTALMLAAQFVSDPNILDLLINKGLSHSTLDKNKCNILMYASRNPDVRIIYYFLKKGINVNYTTFNGATALMNAAMYNINVDVLKALLKAGANIHARNNMGFTALHLASQMNPNNEVVKTLIKAGANINAISRDSWTALMLRCMMFPDQDMINWMLNHGADASMKNAIGQTAYDLAEKHKVLEDTEALKRLKKAAYQ